VCVVTLLGASSWSPDPRSRFVGLGTCHLFYLFCLYLICFVRSVFLTTLYRCTLYRFGHVDLFIERAESLFRGVNVGCKTTRLCYSFLLTVLGFLRSCHTTQLRPRPTSCSSFGVGSNLHCVRVGTLKLNSHLPCIGTKERYVSAAISNSWSPRQQLPS
jgi:hypothetical protein